MKKTLRKPEYWQEFENLCKKLFGEIWGCPLTIKKNGRSGQAQMGVDIYGKPKNSDRYWGVQCKGKDDYTNAELSEKEIDNEISKAILFKPELEVFIFATTANKDAKIEEYIRLKDVESKQKGGFEIIIYCWEDLVDLIEENRETYNYFVNEQQFKDKFEMKISFENKEKVKVINPKYTKTIIKYEYEKPIDYKTLSEQLQVGIDKAMGRNNLSNIISSMPYINTTPFRPSHKNFCWCPFEILITNLGSKVIEDWKFRLYFEKHKYRKIDDDFDDSNPFIYKDIAKFRRTFVYEDDGMILYKPLITDNSLVQKDSRTFKAFILPNQGVEEIILNWELLARDFNKQGTLTLKVNPEIEEFMQVIKVQDKSLLKIEKIEIKEKVEKIDYSPNPLGRGVS